MPPGPPLPLDFDRPRPAFEQRKPNTTGFPRKPDQNIIVEPMRNRGSQRFEQNPRRPIEPTTSENQRVQFKQDNAFGSKIRRPVQQKPVFVTPSPIPVTDEENFDNAVHVTPKSASKKVNYNYHPIIDFFTRDSQSESQYQRQDSNGEPEFTGFSQPEVPKGAHEWTPI